MKKNNVTFHVGSSSLLLIFVVLSLVSFSVLSLSSAVADKKMTDKLEAKTTAYYEACNQAEEQLHTISVSLQELYNAGLSEEAYLKEAGKITSFMIAVSDTQNLEVVIEPIYPQNKGDALYEITRWSLTAVSIPAQDNSLPVIQ